MRTAFVCTGRDMVDEGETRVSGGDAIAGGPLADIGTTSPGGAGGGRTAEMLPAAWAKLSRFWSWEPWVVWRSRWRIQRSWRTKDR